jgi:ribosomal protein L20
MSNNPYVSEMRTTAEAYLAGEEKRTADIAALKERNKQGLMSPIEYAEKMEALMRTQGARNEYRDELKRVRDAYIARVEEWAQVRGEDLTVDAGLLSSGIEINEKDLNDMATRYRANYTMMRAIRDYADARGLAVYRLFKTSPEHKKDAMDGLAEFFNSVTPGGYSALLLQKEGAFEAMLERTGWAETLGDGSELKYHALTGTNTKSTTVSLMARAKRKPEDSEEDNGSSDAE